MRGADSTRSRGGVQSQSQLHQIGDRPNTKGDSLVASTLNKVDLPIMSRGDMEVRPGPLQEIQDRRLTGAALDPGPYALKPVTGIAAR